MSDTNNDGVIARREAIRRVAFLLGGVTFVGGSSLITACERERKSPAAGTSVAEFKPDDIAFLDEVADTILPDTKTPGAKAAKVGAFMATMVTDCYDANDQKIFRDGMRALDESCRKMHGVAFMKANPAQRLALLEQLDREQKRYMDARDAAQRKKAQPATMAGGTPAGEQPVKDTLPPVAPDAPTPYFRMMKELTLLGYFTSEIGCTQAQRYIETPGRYDPCVPYHPGDKTWAPHA